MGLQKAFSRLVEVGSVSQAEIDGPWTACPTEVKNLCPAIRLDENISWFDILMHETLLMGIIQSSAGLQDYV